MLDDESVVIGLVKFTLSGTGQAEKFVWLANIVCHDAETIIRTKLVKP